MASDLLAFGRDNKDPPVSESLPARIAKAQGSTEVDLKPEGRAGTESAQKSGQPTSPDSILVEARDLAKGEKITNLLIDETAAMGATAEAGQAKTHQDTVQPGATDAYSVVFSGGQLAEAGIAGDGNGDLDLIVYDENDHHQSSAAAPGSATANIAAGGPAGPGRFASKSKNLGAVANLYRVATN